MKTHRKPSLRVRALEMARTQLGVKEDPPGSNWGPRVSEYLKSVGLGPNPWCLAFIHWCYLRVGQILPGNGLVQSFDEWAAAHGYLVKRPFRGDIACYDWDGNGWDDHVGIVDRVLGVRWRGTTFVGLIRTIEGNTAIGNDSNGGEVMVRYRWCSGFRVKFARIPG